MQRSLCTDWPSWPCLRCPHLPSLVHSDEISQAGRALPSGRYTLSHCWTGEWPVTGVFSDGNECAISEPLGDCTARSSDHWTLWQYLWKQPEVSPPCEAFELTLAHCQPLGGKQSHCSFYRWRNEAGGYSSRFIQLDRPSSCTPSFGPRDPCLGSQPGSGNMSSNH